MVLTLALFFVATFGLVSAGVVGYWFYRERQSMLTRTPGSDDDPMAWVDPSRLLRSEVRSSISFWDRILAHVDYVEKMQHRLTESGLKWSVGRLTAQMLLAAAVAITVLSRTGWLSAWAAVLIGCSVGLLPYAYVLRVRKRRLQKFESEFPDTLDSLARALHAGHPLSAGLQMLVSEAPEPLATEMRITADERKLGGSWDVALSNLATRVPLPEVSVFVAAVALQNRTGGRLGEVLGRLAESMRETNALKSEVRSVAAHGRLSGNILTALPAFIAVMMSVVNPSYLETLWSNPLGKDLIAAALISLVAAHFVIRKMVDIRI